LSFLAAGSVTGGKSTPSALRPEAPAGPEAARVVGCWRGAGAITTFGIAEVLLRRGSDFVSIWSAARWKWTAPLLPRLKAGSVMVRSFFSGGRWRTIRSLT